MRPLLPVCLLLGTLAISGRSEEDWNRDFSLQRLEHRPRLEVRYTDASRAAFDILAETYHFRGSLRSPHQLRDRKDDSLALDFSLAVDATTYETAAHAAPSRINLYRRGPYYCEVHWLDLGFSAAPSETDRDAAPAPLPLRGDLALYAYPDQLLASLTLHATAPFKGGRLRARGIATQSFALPSMNQGDSHRIAFALLLPHPPLPPERLVSIDAHTPLHYDPVRGCYTIGSRNPGHFQGHFYHHPNHYESAQWRIRNDDRPRTVYLCHSTTEGPLGAVEGGVLLDRAGHPLPITVQISKNFPGEKEEKFYNPEDTPFSETYFPLQLEPGETVELQSLHLYQNWGRHPVKQFSSLGAWMDYFHSSTGVTETTCYVPFKFGGLGGVAIADLRPMSQTFWKSQPQHDNIAGHQFLSYHDGHQWQHLVYQGTTYHSTGPNWMEVAFDYLSSDGKIEVNVRAFELPELDELRHHVKIQLRALEPLTITDAPERLRLMGITSRIQRLRYATASLSGLEDMALAFDKHHFAVRGHPLDPSGGYAGLHGEAKGANAFLLRSWSHRGSTPAASLECQKSGDTYLGLTVAEETFSLDRGDTLTFEATFMPYGEGPGRRPLDEERKRLLRLQTHGGIDVLQGEGLSLWPPRIRAQDGQAEFIVRHPDPLLPLIVTGLKHYQWPLIERQEGSHWERLPTHQVSEKDGSQVFVDAAGTFGAVFLLEGPLDAQRLRVRSGTAPQSQPRARVVADPPGHLHLHPNQGPARVVAFREDASWNPSEGNSWWREWRRPEGLYGFRCTPFESEAAIQFWFQNDSQEARAPDSPFTTPPGIHWNDSEVRRQREGSVEKLSFPQCPPGRRYHVYGRLPLNPGTP